MEKSNFNKFQNYNAIKLLRDMPHAFKVYFDEFGINWIKRMCLALQNSQPVLPLSDNDHGSFFYQFVKFHIGAFRKEDVLLLDKNLKEFCFLCGKIESLTDSWPIIEKEPIYEEKEKLLNYLQNLLEILPSADQFQIWVESSLKSFT